MIFAELHGKLGTDGSRAHERSEDLLTSTAFGLFRYLPLDDGLLALLRRVRVIRLALSGVRSERDPGWIDVKRATSAEVVFWPTFERYGQPDVLFRFRDVKRALLGVVLVEAKLYAPKSGSAGPDAGEVAEDETPDPDQLVKYWQGLQQYVRSLGPCPTWLVYLTAHSSPPVRELADALRRLRHMRLGWLSWFDVFEVASACDALPAKDLSALLARKGFRAYNGFTAAAVDVPNRSGFWHPAPTLAAARVRAASVTRRTRSGGQWFSGAARSAPQRALLECNMTGDLGRSITRAARFMMQIRQDVLQMLASLDGLLLERGWQGVLMSKLSTQHPLSHVFRLYTQQEAGTRNRMIGVVAELDPPVPIEEAMMLIVAAEFSDDVDQRDVWNNWYRTACQDVIQTLGVSPTAVTIPRDLLNADRFMSDATAGKAIIIPLAGLTDADELKLQVVDPILVALAEFA